MSGFELSCREPFVLRSLGTPRSVLDVGCGSGRLCRALVDHGVSEVVGVDLHEPSLEWARTAAPRAKYVRADFLTASWPPESFDGIVSMNALHHMDFSAALKRVDALLAPGGRFVAVGLAARVWRQLPLDAVAFVARRFVAGRRKSPEPMHVCWPPPLDYDQVRAIARVTLPGVEYRRHLMGQYSLTWTKPR